MARYMFDFGEVYEFEAKNCNEVVSSLKKILRREDQSDKTFCERMRSDAVSWNGADLRTQCNRTFVKSLTDAEALINLSEQSEKQKTSFLSKWSDNGFGDLHFDKQTSRQLEVNKKLALNFREIAYSLDEFKLAEVLNCKLDGAHYLKRYKLLTNAKQRIPEAFLSFVLTTIRDEELVNPAASYLFNYIYVQFPNKLFDFAVMWQFILYQPIGSEFVKSALIYLADLLTKHPNQRHELISDYLPSKDVPAHAKLYFAYGSNMDHDQMVSRCPSAEFIGLASLKNFAYYINNRGVASLKPQYGATAWGVVWDIQDTCDWEALDQYEGVSFDYYKRLSIETDFSGEFETCQVYISTTPGQGAPRVGYQEKITQTVLFHKKLYEKEYAKMDSETFSELCLNWENKPFKFWYNEMNYWLGAENG